MGIRIRGAALLIYALGDLGEKTALPIVLEAAGNSSPDVRRLPSVHSACWATHRSSRYCLPRPSVTTPCRQPPEEASLILRERKSMLPSPRHSILPRATSGWVLIGLNRRPRNCRGRTALKQAVGDEDLEVATAAIKALSTTIELDE